MDRMRKPIPPENVQATLCQLTSQTIVDALNRASPEPGSVFACGGGTHNSTLMAALRELLPDWRLDTTDALGIGSDWVEAAAFAWLACRPVEGLPGNVPAVTGASKEAILGAIYAS